MDVKLFPDIHKVSPYKPLVVYGGVLSFGLKLRIKQFAAHFLMPVVHVFIDSHEHHNLKQEVNPRLINQGCHIEGYAACVEREEIGVFHQREALLSELVPHLLRNVISVCFLQFFPILLEHRSFLLLIVGVVFIEP